MLLYLILIGFYVSGELIDSYLGLPKETYVEIVHKENFIYYVKYINKEKVSITDVMKTLSDFMDDLDYPDERVFKQSFETWWNNDNDNSDVNKLIFEVIPKCEDGIIEFNTKILKDDV